MEVAGDRREKQRVVTWFPVRLEAANDGRGMAVAKNVSERGILLASGRRFTVGEPVDLWLHLRPGEEDPRKLTGTVVRIVPNDEDPDGLWRHKIAVEFLDPDPALIVGVLEAEGSVG